MNLTKLAQHKILELYKEALQNDKQMNGNIKSVLKQINGSQFLSKFLNHNVIDNLQSQLSNLAGRICKYSQTDPDTNAATEFTQTPKSIVEISNISTVTTFTQTTKYFRVRADWHTSPKFDLPEELAEL